MARRDQQLDVFFDGACPVCRREVATLRRVDRRKRLQFIDIAAAGFDALAETGHDQATLMARMHVRGGDGSWASGVEALRQIYVSVGLGWLVPLTRLPVITRLLDFANASFAHNRHRFKGHCDDESCAAVG